MPFLLRWLARRSLWFLHACGSALGWAGYLLSPTYRARLRENAALAGITAADRREAVRQAGQLVMELPRLWLRPRDEPMADPARWAGREQLERWVDSPQGLVLLTPHMGSFEVAAQAYAETFGARKPMTVLYRPARKHWLRELEETARARPHLATAPATLGGVRQMLRALKRGETVGLLPDQVPPEGMGVWAPFFGRSAYTMTLATRLVRQTGAQFGVLCAERLARGAGYVVHVLPPPQLAAEADDEADAIALNRAMEQTILQRPGQYLWGYHRYKAPRAPA